MCSRLREGFDCPGCAWPEPREADGEHRKPAEFYENGAKAVAEEATKRRVGPEFFAQHSIEELEAAKRRGAKIIAVNPLPEAGLMRFRNPQNLSGVIGRGRLILQTLRSHDQYNTTIYGLSDRYRGIEGGRRVVFINPEDLAERGFADGDLVDLVSEWTQDGTVSERRAALFRAVAYRAHPAAPRRTSPRRTPSSRWIRWPKSPAPRCPRPS